MGLESTCEEMRAIIARIQPAVMLRKGVTIA